MLGVAESLDALLADLLSPNAIISSWRELHMLVLNGLLPSWPELVGNLQTEELICAGSPLPANSGWDIPPPSPCGPLVATGRGSLREGEKEKSRNLILPPLALSSLPSLPPILKGKWIEKDPKVNEGNAGFTPAEIPPCVVS